jgi:membrane fusion protein (multidrug efflux system)
MALILALAAALAVGGCGRPPGDERASAPEAAVPVEVTVLALSRAVTTVTATGTIRAAGDVQVSSEANGRVIEIPASVGDAVDVGDALVRLDPELAELAVQQARAQLLTADAERGDAELGLKRAEYLWKNGDISDLDYETAQTRVTAAQAMHATAEAGLAAAERQLRDTLISAPITGRVAFIYVEEGQLIAMGVPVAHVVNDDSLEVDFGVGEDRVVDLRAGLKATVTVRSLPGEEFAGRVEYVGRRADDMTKTYPVRVVLQNRGGRLRSGMVAEVSVAAREIPNAIVIERDWVIDRYGEPAVFVAVDSTAVLRKVELGAVLGGQVVVSSGLEPGERLISVGHTQVRDGAAIEVKSGS